jgi:hypothetical protein
MPYTIHYNDDEGIITVNYSGVVTDDDLLNSLKEKTSSIERVKACKFSLNDFTNSTGFEVTSNGMRENAAISIELSKLNQNVIPILIAPNDLEFGMSRIWLAYSGGTNWKSRIVRTYEEALELMNENK